MARHLRPTSRTQPALMLLINAGSSSVKISIRHFDVPVRVVLHRSISLAELHRPAPESPPHGAHLSTGADLAADRLAEWLKSVMDESQIDRRNIAVAGHRIVLAGPKITRHQLLTAKVRKALVRLIDFDPQHLPLELAFIDACRQLFPRIPQAACFDSVFHQTMPLISKVLPISWNYYTHGVRRFGFHGLSYASLMRQLRLVDPQAARGRTVIAHLGSGCSLAAMNNGRSVATTMAFTPSAGVVMGGRTGDIDPGVILYIMKREKFTPADMEQWLEDHGGLAGIAGCADMQSLLCRKDARASLAVDIFCRGIARQIGAYAAELNGIDAVVFSGGIGEKAPEVRRRIIHQLSFMGMAIDAAANRASRQQISPAGSRPRVWCLRTDEEQEMASIIKLLLKGATR